MAVPWDCFPVQATRKGKMMKAIYLYKSVIVGCLNYSAKIQQIMGMMYFLGRNCVLME
jgi:hypothetical protein